MNESQAIVAMSALSHETRLKIVRHLVKAGAEGETAGSIGEAVNAAPSKLHFIFLHLNEQDWLVRNAGLGRSFIESGSK